MYVCLIGLALWIILLWVFRKSRLLPVASGVSGVLSLLFLNTFTPYVLHINLCTVLTAAVLGVPGVGGIYLLKILF